MFRNGKRHGICKILLHENEEKIDEICGEYILGKLNGKAKVKYRDGRSLIGYFKEGRLHGFVRYFDKSGRLTFLGTFCHGCFEGICWKIIKGGGFVVGKVDESGLLSGEELVYLYPDLE